MVVRMVRGIFGGLCIVFGLMFIGNPWKPYLEQKKLANEGVRTTAKVTGKKIWQRHDGPDGYSITYTFKPEGRAAVTVSKGVKRKTFGRVYRGSPIEVIYDKDDPQKGYPVGEKPHAMNVIGPFIGAAFGMVWIAIGAAIIFVPWGRILERLSPESFPEHRATTLEDEWGSDVIDALGKVGATLERDDGGQASLHGDENFTDESMALVKGLPNLERLFLGDTQITDNGLRHLAGMSALKTVVLFGERPNPNITNAGLEHLKGLTNLEILNLYGTRVTDEGLRHLQNMQRLRALILSPQITDAGLEHLEGLAGLRTLEITGTQITDAGVERLEQALPNCEIFDASDEE